MDYLIGPIESAIPIPEKIKPLSLGYRNYRFRDMYIGDSFFTTVPRALVARSACQFGGTHNQHFTVRDWIEKDIPGVRVWRTR